MRGNHIPSVGKIEAVEGFDQVPGSIVNMDAAAALGGAGVWLRDEEEPVDRVEFDVSAEFGVLEGGKSPDGS